MTPDALHILNFKKFLSEFHTGVGKKGPQSIKQNHESVVQGPQLINQNHQSVTDSILQYRAVPLPVTRFMVPATTLFPFMLTTRAEQSRPLSGRGQHLIAVSHQPLCNTYNRAHSPSLIASCRAYRPGSGRPNHGLACLPRRDERQRKRCLVLSPWCGQSTRQRTALLHRDTAHA